MSRHFEKLLSDSVRFHGHLCGGQVIGVKMAMAALRELGIRDPGGSEGMDLIIFSEIDRCPLDAIISVTKRTPGKRSVKMLDYGKTAATFFNAGTGQAVRVSLQGEALATVEAMAQSLMPAKDEKAAHIAALIAIPEDELLMVRPVRVQLRPEDLPGESLQSVFCESCGEQIRDKREAARDGKTLCRPCAEGKAYYDVL